MEPELRQAFDNLLEKVNAIDKRFDKFEERWTADHDQLIETKARQDEIIRDVDAIGDKVRGIQATVWKISLIIAGSGAGLSALINAI